MTEKNVWILDEGSQGHTVQSRGMVRELAKAVPLACTEIPLPPVAGGRLGRSLAKRLLRAYPKPWLLRLLHRGIVFPNALPDLIVSSGPHSLKALELLGKHYGCPNVFIQGTVRVPEGAVTAVMRPYEGEERCDYIFIPLLFTEITPGILEAARNEFFSRQPLRPTGPANALFVGNSSAKIRFTDADWDSIIRFVNGQWKLEGRQWLLTTSYRTGADLENRFRRGIDPDALLDAVWYVDEPRRVTKAYLGLADRVYVTMDSLTMLTEAVASGRPTTALCPEHLPEENPNTHLSYVRGLEAKGLIDCMCPGAAIISPGARQVPREADYTASIMQLLERIGWQP